MNEPWWAQCRSFGHALQLLNGAAKDANHGWHRKFRLCGCYLFRDLAPYMPDDSFHRALDVAERYFDREATRPELRRAVTRAQRGYEIQRSDLETVDALTAQDLMHLFDAHPSTTASAAFRAVGRVYRADRNASGIALLRELFGNPFRPVTFLPEWRTDTAASLAQGMYASRDFGAMPILADALQDAGCENEDVLIHCRDTEQVHVRGCWVVDLVLGKA